MEDLVYKMPSHVPAWPMASIAQKNNKKSLNFSYNLQSLSVLISFVPLTWYRNPQARRWWSSYRTCLPWSTSMSEMVKVTSRVGFTIHCLIGAGGSIVKMTTSVFTFLILCSYLLPWLIPSLNKSSENPK